MTAHARGEVGGILDVSEFGRPNSCYLDQNTDLQDEVAANPFKETGSTSSRGLAAKRWNVSFRCAESAFDFQTRGVRI